MAKMSADTDFEYWLGLYEMEDEDDREAIIDAIRNGKSVRGYNCVKRGAFKILTAQYGDSSPLKIVSTEAETALIKVIEDYVILEEDESEEGFKRNMEGRNT